MGLAASQARLLLLTARKSDLELRAQQITNTEMILAMQTERIATEYSNKLSNKVWKMQVVAHQTDSAYSQNVDLTLANLNENNFKVVYSGTSQEFNDSDVTPADFQDMLKRGVLTIVSAKADGNGNFVLPLDESKNIDQSYVVGLTGSSRFYETYYTEDDDAATAEYESKMAEIQTKEKKLQIDLKQVENQQKACDTEIDSVKKIIDKNIERTFKTFA